MTLKNAFSWFAASAACGSCRKDVFALRRTCPHCGRAYPTSRPAFYWAYVTISIVAVPALIVFAVKSWA